MRGVASMLLHVVRLLELVDPRPVGFNEIEQATKRWLCDSEASRHRRTGMASPYTFQLVATNWLHFQGLLLQNPQPTKPFGNLLSDFLEAMRSERGMALETLKSYGSQISTFLSWLQQRRSGFSDVTALDIEEYLDLKRSCGWTRNSVASCCSALRTFFGHAEVNRWCSNGIRECISRPRVPRIAENLNGPPWEQVRRIIATMESIRPADLRAKAMILLFSIYGFRSAEVRGLSLDDIDWRRGSITVHRAKRGIVQQFPLQSEVGEAIASYLVKARPKCSCRNLFVTLNPPYRPVDGSSMGTIFGRRLRNLGVLPGQFGPHMLRRACATQLLRTGSSLKDIADFLGHKDLQSVGIYARFDVTSLVAVSKFSLRGVL
jgi:site-specific recombinase XerD